MLPSQRQANIRVAIMQFKLVTAWETWSTKHVLKAIQIKSLSSLTDPSKTTFVFYILIFFKKKAFAADI
jgi:hypothetical protein